MSSKTPSSCTGFQLQQCCDGELHWQSRISLGWSIVRHAHAILPWADTSQLPWVLLLEDARAEDTEILKSTLKSFWKVAMRLFRKFSYTTWPPKGRLYKVTSRHSQSAQRRLMANGTVLLSPCPALSLGATMPNLGSNFNKTSIIIIKRKDISEAWFTSIFIYISNLWVRMFISRMDQK